MTPLATRNRALVGIAGLAVLAFLAALVGAASGLSIGARGYTAVLAHTGGLRVGEEVQVAGVGVGEVTAIELAGQQVRVDFTVDDDIHLGTQTSAEVKVATLLGTHFLAVDPGGSGRLPDDEVPLSRTRVPFNLQDVLDEGVPEIQEFDATAIQRSLGRLAETLGRSGDDLGPALDGVKELSTLVARRSEDIGRLLRASRNVTRQLTSSGGDLVTLMRQADAILDTLRSRRDTIHALLGDLTRFGRHLAGAIRDTRADIGPVLADLETVTGVLRKHDRSLDRAIRTLAPASRYFANAGGTGPWLDQYAPGAVPDGVRCLQERTCR